MDLVTLEGPFECLAGFVDPTDLLWSGSSLYGAQVTLTTRLMQRVTSQWPPRLEYCVYTPLTPGLTLGPLWHLIPAVTRAFGSVRQHEVILRGRWSPVGVRTAQMGGAVHQTGSTQQYCGYTPLFDTWIDT